MQMHEALKRLATKEVHTIETRVSIRTADGGKASALVKLNKTQTKRLLKESWGAASGRELRINIVDGWMTIS